MNPQAPSAGSRTAGLLLLRAPRAALAAAVLLVAGIGVVDWLTGPDFSLAIFYILAVGIATWWGGRGQGLAVALLATAAWVVCDQASRHYVHPTIGYWNGSVRLATWATISLLLTAVRASAERDLQARAGGPRSEARADSFYGALDQAFARLRQTGIPFTLVYLETAGVHGPGLSQEGAAGPEQLLAALRATMRHSDRIAAPRGREVALLLVETTPEAAAVALGRITAELRRFMEQSGQAGGAASVGAITCLSPLADVNTVIQRAYQQMYYGPRVPGEVSLSHETVPAAGATQAAPALA